MLSLSKEMYPFEKIVPMYDRYLEELKCFEPSIPFMTNQKIFNMFQNIRLRNDAHVHLMLDDDQIVGFVIITQAELLYTKADYCIEEFFVIPERRREGIGLNIFKQIIKRYQGMGSLYVLKANLPAQSFWNKVLECNACTVQEETSDLDYANLYTYRVEMR